jgi:hypothetical protein
VPGKSIASNFTAKTFIYTGDEAGQNTATSGAGAPANPTPAPRGKAAANAETLKSRAEGRGIE